MGGLKPVLWVPNLALSFCYMTRIMNNRNGNVKHKTKHLVCLTVNTVVGCCSGDSPSFFHGMSY